MLMVMLLLTMQDLEEKKMQTKIGMGFSPIAESKYKKLLINMIYKLLPIREEKNDWQNYLKSLIEEIHGFNNLFEEIDEVSIIRILSKLEGLKDLDKEEDFYLYRKTVLECTNLIK